MPDLEDANSVIKTVFAFKPRYLFVLWFPCAFLAFSPTTILDRLGMTSFVEQYRGWIGSAALLFFVLWIVQLYSTFSESRKAKKEKIESEKEFEEYKDSVIKYLYNNSLSQGEAFFICYALYKKQQVVYAGFTNKHAQALLRKGLLTATPGLVSMRDYPFLIPDFVWNHLQKNEDKILPQEPEQMEGFLQHVNSYDRAPGWQKDMMFE